MTDLPKIPGNQLGDALNLLRLPATSRSRYSGGTVQDFARLGDLQRGYPERAMLRVQHTMGGGVLNPVVEHSGDLVHRMTHNAPYDYFGYDEAGRKINNVLHILTNPYGFEREMNTNIRNNADYRNISPDLLRSQVGNALSKFGLEHSKLPAYNEAHDISNNINMNLGNQNWGEAINGLNKLRPYLDSPEAWNDFVTQGLKR